MPLKLSFASDITCDICVKMATCSKYWQGLRLITCKTLREKLQSPSSSLTELGDSWFLFSHTFFAHTCTMKTWRPALLRCVLRSFRVKQCWRAACFVFGTEWRDCLLHARPTLSPLFNQALRSAIVWSVVSAQILSLNYSVEIKHPDLPVLNMPGNNQDWLKIEWLGYHYH